MGESVLGQQCSGVLSSIDLQMAGCFVLGASIALRLPADRTPGQMWPVYARVHATTVIDAQRLSSKRRS